jgi:hypothetical protein
MKIISITIFILIVSSRFLFSQEKKVDNFYNVRNIDFIGDKNPKNPDKKDDDLLDSIFKIDKDFEFELRLWVQGAFKTKSAFVMSNKDNHWKIRYFDWDGSLKRNFKLREISLKDADINSLWRQINEQHHICIIPSGDSIIYECTNYYVDFENPENSRIRRTEILDGASYNFEILMPNQKRYFSYSNPSGFLKSCPSNEILYHVTISIAFIEKFVRDNRI